MHRNTEVETSTPGEEGIVSSMRSGGSTQVKAKYGTSESLEQLVVSCCRYFVDLSRSVAILM